jgi:hypothetical protein
MPETVNTTEFGERVDAALYKSKNTRRWLMGQLKSFDVDFTDTQLSNRCTGYIPFREDEMIAIEKVFKKNKIEF